MPSRTVAVASSVGLHARPASIFTEAVTTSGLDVTIAYDGGAPIDAASILLVMALGVPHGGEVTLAAEGSDAEGVLDALATLLATDLDEVH
jgi:phosphocarrier protein HPr